MEKTLDCTSTETAVEKVKDLVLHGNPNAWVCLCKASSKTEGWMKSTKVLEVPGHGVFLQVTTQQGDQIAESVTFAPGVRLALSSEDATVVLKPIRYMHGPAPDQD